MASTAQEWGLVARVVDDEDALAAGTELVAALAAGPTQALAHTARLLRSAWEVDRETHTADEAATIASRVVSDEAAPLVERFA